MINKYCLTQESIWARHRSAVTMLAVLMESAFVVWGGQALAQNSIQKSFATPEEAAQALAGACAADDVARLLAILGPAGRVLITSGDEVADRASRERLARAFHDKHRLVPKARTSRSSTLE